MSPYISETRRRLLNEMQTCEDCEGRCMCSEFCDRGHHESMCSCPDGFEALKNNLATVNANRVRNRMVGRAA